MDPAKINVLVADDSKVARMLLVHLLESDPRICVQAVVNGGEAAVEYLQSHKPDVVLMDLHMPGLDGFETTRRIMETVPVPIIICTATTDAREVAFSFRSLEAGAVACVEKPVSPENPAYNEQAAHLLQTVRLMSEVKVVRRWPRSRRAKSSDGTTPASTQEDPAPCVPPFVGI